MDRISTGDCAPAAPPPPPTATKALYPGRKAPKGTGRYSAMHPPQNYHADLVSLTAMQEIEQEEAVDSPNGKPHLAYPSCRQWCQDKGVKWIPRKEIRDAARQEWDLIQQDLQREPDDEEPPANTMAWGAAQMMKQGWKEGEGLGKKKDRRLVPVELTTTLELRRRLPTKYAAPSTAGASG